MLDSDKPPVFSDYCFVSDRKIVEFIEFINDNSADGTVARLGVELEFIVRNGFDSSGLIPMIAEWMEEENSPFAADLNKIEGTDEDRKARLAQFAREVHSQIRAYFRAKLVSSGLLSDGDCCSIAEVEYPTDYPRLPKREPGSEIANLHKITPNEAQAVARFVERYHPNEAVYYRAVVRKSKDQGFVYPNDVGRTGLVEATIRQSAQYILGKDDFGTLEPVKLALRSR